MKIKNHLLESAKQLDSPNFGDRPQDCAISLLVVHNISLPPGEFGGPYIDELFCNTLDYDGHPYFEGLKELRVSSHLLIRRDGAITQYVPFDKRARHAGVSSFEGRQECNDFSIGIELEGTDFENFTSLQYDRLIEVTQELMRHYPEITPARMTGHSDIAPDRKTDPGPCFDWDRFRSAMTE